MLYVAPPVYDIVSGVTMAVPKVIISTYVPVIIWDLVQCSPIFIDYQQPCLGIYELINPNYMVFKVVVGGCIISIIKRIISILGLVGGVVHSFINDIINNLP